MRSAKRNKAGTVESVLFLFFASFILAIFTEYSDRVVSSVQIGTVAHKIFAGRKLSRFASSLESFLHAKGPIPY